MSNKNTRYLQIDTSLITRHNDLQHGRRSISNNSTCYIGPQSILARQVKKKTGWGIKRFLNKLSSLMKADKHHKSHPHHQCKVSLSDGYCKHNISLDKHNFNNATRYYTTWRISLSVPKNSVCYIGLQSILVSHFVNATYHKNWWEVTI